ncbi:putative protein phosphatase 2C 11 [Drosera capensis]
MAETASPPPLRPPPSSPSRDSDDVFHSQRWPLVEARSPVPSHSSVLTRDPDALFSGGGIRASMEDYFEAKISEVNGQMVAFFVVFDGHDGFRTAEYLKNNLFNNLCCHPDFIKDTKSAIKEKGQKKDAGSTASTASLVGDRLFVANVGDSKVVATREGSGTWRVGGVLAVSRAFGDKLLRPYVVAEPEIQEQDTDDVDFIIIASDGLWNVISNKDAVSIVQKINDAEAASRKLTEEAYARGSSDSITCLVVRFDKSEH